MSDLVIEARDGSGSFGGYLATPESGGGPGIVVIQEIFGVNAAMRRICDWLAGEGYVAFCPDLFWRIEPGIELTDKTDEEWQKAFELYKAFDVDKGVEDIAATLKALRAHRTVNGRVGSVGYCLGGLLAYLTACRTSADANVGYYGVGIDAHLDEAESMAGYLALHIAEEDQFVDKAAQKRIHEALDEHPRVTIWDYPGVDHAFARPDGINFNAEAAALANRRTLDFFAKHLKD
ncbi:MAG: dienelactone hydrolase family protein [Alphaproteobacteria bacterium]|nr:MAG: dienelactone hydrolase family protein [Alphaproteobacteria bacterium]